jgi:hypothetical protein
MLDDAREETVSQTGDGEPDTREAEAFVTALNHSAERMQTLWFSFLTFMLYLAIATGTTTHRMLFLESPLNLPVLNIALPLLGFYILTPIIFVVFHFYILLNLVLLARLDPAKALEGEDEMAKIWAAHERESPSPEDYAKSLERQWLELGCATVGAPYVLHGLIAELSYPDFSPFRDQSDAAKALAVAFLDEAHCPGAHGRSEADKAELE